MKWVTRSDLGSGGGSGVRPMLFSCPDKCSIESGAHGGLCGSVTCPYCILYSSVQQKNSPQTHSTITHNLHYMHQHDRDR